MREIVFDSRPKIAEKRLFLGEMETIVEVCYGCSVATDSQ